MPPRKSTVVPISRALQDEDYSFVLCRTLGHSWEAHKTDDYAGDYSEQFLLSLQCTRCRKVRRDFVNPWSGELISRQYVDPEHYDLSADIREAIAAQQIRLRQAYRLELVLRMNEQAATVPARRSRSSA